MSSARIELAPHQIAAVTRALHLLRDRGGVILADDVGLGKSIVAAAVAAQIDATIECIVPASLVAQWRETLRAFDVDAPITTPDRIIHEAFAPRVDGERLIIVDEAHGFRNPATERYEALARRSIGARLLLVTATPVCNSPDDLHALVALIAPDDGLRSAGVASIDDAFRSRDATGMATVMRELVIRRGREVLVDDLQFGILERQVVWHDVPDVPIDALTFPLVAGHAPLLRSVLWRRLESSEAALLESLKRHTRFYERALDCLASGRTLTKRDYHRAFGDEDADALQEVLFWEVFAGDEARGDAEEIRGEIQRLDTLRRSVERSPRKKLDSLMSICASNVPVLIFTSAIATARAIFTAVEDVRRAGLMTSRGATPDNALDAFRGGSIDVLVCTDLAAEGLNLQRAGIVVHYDMPWNPVKIDQRNGRAFRIGQLRTVVRATYFLPRGRRTRVTHIIAAKNRIRRHLLNGNPPPRTAFSLPALPQHLPRTAPAIALLDALRRHGLDAPAAIGRRYRAGIERIFAAMADGYLDARRVCDLTLLMERERIIAGGAPRGSSDR